jgi:3-hydroxymyristoyl/3-hydroxydecanoyl-(acyl carrier protein) dehydratase
VPALHPCLPGHFPGQAIVPGVLLLDLVLQAVQRLTGQELRYLEHIKFTSALLPGEQAQGWCEAQGLRIVFRVTAQRGETAVAIAEGAGRASLPVREGRPA